jgi:hypothetical protein
MLGILIGAGGQYLADKYTDRRRESESRSASKKSFKRLAALMPSFLAELQDDLKNPDAAAVREFFVLPTPGVMLGGSNKHRFRYNESEHQSLKEHIDLLRDAGFVADLTTPRSAPIFRMTEDFVDLVLAHRVA